jgi:hypothetical protein
MDTKSEAKKRVLKELIDLCGGELKKRLKPKEKAKCECGKEGCEKCKPSQAEPSLTQSN